MISMTLRLAFSPWRGVTCRGYAERFGRGHGHRIVATSQQSAAMSEMIDTLERDNMRLRGMLGVERQRVDRLRR
ncbi:hypothetical protein Tco_0437175, partial [Tanacetum coccineum]